MRDFRTASKAMPAIFALVYLGGMAIAAFYYNKIGYYSLELFSLRYFVIGSTYSLIFFVLALLLFGFIHLVRRSINHEVKLSNTKEKVKLLFVVLFALLVPVYANFVYEELPKSLGGGEYINVDMQLNINGVTSTTCRKQLVDEFKDGYLIYSDGNSEECRAKGYTFINRDIVLRLDYHLK